jgi:adenosylhomocysteine nucleosidase
MIAVFVAMPYEVEACISALSPVREASVGGFAVKRGNVGLVCHTGMGRIAERAARSVLEHVSPRVALSVGTSGGLNADLQVGDLVLCDRVDQASQPPTGTPADTVRANGELIAIAREAGLEAALSVRIGGSVTVDEVAWGPEEKRRLRDWGGHDVVEMESYWVGRVARELGIPFLAVRVVTDDADATIPNIPGLMNVDGTMNQQNLLAYTAEHPEATQVLADMHRKGGIALDRLRAFFDEFLPRCARALPPERMAT